MLMGAVLLNMSGAVIQQIRNDISGSCCDLPGAAAHSLSQLVSMLSSAAVSSLIGSQRLQERPAHTNKNVEHMIRRSMC
jgi:hypothetical protein